MASWEDEDFDVPVASTNDFGEEGEELMGDWEAGLESDDDKPKVVKPKVSSAQRIASRKQKEQEERERKAMEKTATANKKDQLQREVDADMDNATDLLAAADIHPRSRGSKDNTHTSSSSGPAKLSDFAVFKPTKASEYTELRKTLAPVINALAEKNSLMLHTNFIIELCRDLCQPLSSDQTNKVTSTLTAVANQKYREERARRLNNRQKPQIKQASAKQETQIKAPESLADDGLDDDDFM